MPIASYAVLRCCLRFAGVFAMCSATASLTGCYLPKTNPSFDVETCEASAALTQLRKDPRPLHRPLVIVGGWIDPGFGPAIFARRVQQATGDNRVLPIDMAFAFTMESARQRLIERVIERFGVDEHGQPLEVDVVGLSMGGLVARYAALPVQPDRERSPDLPLLRIARLYTVASPHRGAQMAPIPTFDDRVIDMRPGSDFLLYLDTAGDPAISPQAQPPPHGVLEARLGYPITAYAVVPDHIVGSANSTPSDRFPHWIDPPLITLSPHLSALKDPRIAADILLRVLGEPPLASDEPAPLPD
ncbi:MAG: hypothetical protein AAF288_11055 [Planctomycetota bacterium]